MKRIFLVVVLFCTFGAAGCATKGKVHEAAEPPLTTSREKAPDQQSAAENPGRDAERQRIAEENAPTTVAQESPKTGDDADDEASLHLKTVYFDFDSWLLSRDMREVLAENAKWLTANPAKQVRLEGHTDERGSDSYNMALGEKRAKAVQEYIGHLGVKKGRLAVVSYGEEKPVDEGATEEAWRKNRRVEFRVIK